MDKIEKQDDAVLLARAQGGGEVCAHHWHDYGQMNVSWCHKCEAKAVTGYEDRPFTAPPSAPVGVESVRADYQPAFDTPTTAGEALAWLSKQGEPTCMTFCADKARRAAELLRDALQQPTTDSATASVFAELDRAVRKFPTWPTDPLHAVAVLREEFGELTKAVLQSVYEPHKVKPGEVRQEALQTAAMALRFLRSLDAYVFATGAQHNQPALAQQPAAVDGATLRQALHAMKRCQRESGGKQWSPWITKVEAALAAQPGGSDNQQEGA